MAALPTANPQFPRIKASTGIATPESSLATTSIRVPTCNSQNHEALYSTNYPRTISFLCKDGRLHEALNLFTQMGIAELDIGHDIYGEILQGCVYKRALSTGKQIHAQILKKSDTFARNEFIETKLLIFYAKCEAFDIANRLFSRLKSHNVFSWSAMIGLNCRMGYKEEALMWFLQMQENGFLPDNFVVPNALKACGALQWVGLGRGVHGYVVKVGFDGCVFVMSSLIDMYCKCGALKDAKKVFDGMSDTNVVTWNSMITGYMQNGLNEEAMYVFSDMRVEGIQPSQVSLSGFLSASGNLGAIEEGMQGHALVVLCGLELNNILGSSIVYFYSKVGLIEDAELVFARIVEKDVVTWNLLISCYLQHGLFEKALDLCHSMRSQHLRFDSVTLVHVLGIAAGLSDIRLGKECHCYCIRHNVHSDVVITSSLVDLYSKCGKIDVGRQIFNSTPEKDVILWNMLLGVYAEAGFSGEALKLFYHMQLENVPPNIVSWNAVISGFVRKGQLSEAKEMFLQMQSIGITPNHVTWSLLISALARNGSVNDVIQCCLQMQDAGVKPCNVCITCLLSAFRGTALLQYGRAVHGYAIRLGFSSELHVATSLVEMYAKSGFINQAKLVFDMTPSKELAVYNAMISAYAVHGQAREALSLYNYLLSSGMKLDGITVTNVLSACSHGGRVKEGMKIFHEMLSDHLLEPSMEHYSCMISLLSRTGNFSEAFKLINRMPYEPDPQMVGSLLAACREHGEVELVEWLSEKLLSLEPDNSGNYVSILNTFAAAGRWDEVSEMRNLMKEKGLRKDPGCSWIQIEGEVEVFVAGDRSHTKTEEISEALMLLRTHMNYHTEILCS